MKLCRFKAPPAPGIRIGLIVTDDTVRDLTVAGVRQLTPLLERIHLHDELARLSQSDLPEYPLDRVRLLTPVESQEVWAAGVTYLRSKQARMAESEFSASAYDRVYDAERPEIYTSSCAVGPWIVVGLSEDEAREWSIHLEIRRGVHRVFSAETCAGQLKRRFADLVDYLFRSQAFPSGAVLLTGAGVVPPDSFTLEAGDDVRITVSGIGTLENPVTVVSTRDTCP